MTDHGDKRHSFTDQTQQGPVMTAHELEFQESSENGAVKEVADAAVDPEAQSNDDDVFPGDNGDWRAIVCLIGVFFALFVGFGVLNIPGTFVTYWQNNQLEGYSTSDIGWIAAIQFFLTLGGSVFTGRWFDLHGGKMCLLIGSVGFLIGFFMVSLCTEYYQFFLAYGILLGVTASMMFACFVDVSHVRFIPAVGVTAQWFYRHRGLASGMTFTAGSVAGIVFPISMRKLFLSVGFPWTVRIVGFIWTASLVIGNLLIRARIQPKKFAGRVIDLSALKDIRFALLGGGIFFSDWSLFGPITYITSYALAQNIDPNLAYYVIAFLNIGSCLGRVIPGVLADRLGPFNVMLCCSSLTAIFAFGLWLPSTNAAATIAYAIIFGFTSGGYISLMPVLVGRISELREFGTRYGTVMMFASFASLTGVPIGGALVRDHNTDYTGLILWTGCTNVVATFFFILARWRVGGLSLFKFV